MSLKQRTTFWSIIGLILFGCLLCLFSQVTSIVIMLCVLGIIKAIGYVIAKIFETLFDFNLDDMQLELDDYEHEIIYIDADESDDTDETDCLIELEEVEI